MQKKELYKKINHFILENANLAYLVLDTEGNVILCQGNAITLLGYQPQELTDKNIFTIFKHEEQLLNDFRKCRNEAIPFESHLNTHNVHFRVKYLPEHTNNEVIYVISLLMDITQEAKLNTENIKLKKSIKKRELVKNWLTFFGIASGLIMGVFNFINLAEENTDLQRLVAKQNIDKNILMTEVQKLQEQNEEQHKLLMLQAKQITLINEELTIWKLKYGKNGNR